MLRSMVKEDRRIRRTLWKEKKEGRDGGRESESRIIVNFRQEDLNCHWEERIKKEFRSLVMCIKIHTLVLPNTLATHAVKKRKWKNKNNFLSTTVR